MEPYKEKDEVNWLEHQLRYYQEKCQYQEDRIIELEFRLEEASRTFKDQLEFLEKRSRKLKDYTDLTTGQQPGWKPIRAFSIIRITEAEKKSTHGQTVEFGII